jgi:hypothetical protein
VVAARRGETGQPPRLQPETGPPRSLGEHQQDRREEIQVKVLRYEMTDLTPSLVSQFDGIAGGFTT